MRRTKIIATIGPVSDSREVLKKLMYEGVNVFRLNMSHGTHDWHREIIQRIHGLSSDLGFNVAILADLQGPKIRMGLFNEPVSVADGDLVHLSTAAKIPAGALPVDYPELAKDVKRGETLLVDDGKLIFRVEESDSISEVRLRVVQGGVIRQRKGINLPGTAISQPALSGKDRNDLALLLEEDVDWIALSFVRSATDVKELRELVPEEGPAIIAKIEKPEAIRNIDEIIQCSDAIMVARGDLGIEIPIQQVPLIQKDIVKRCLIASRPVIIATQMMETMIGSMTPTRAEVSDVANSVMDGADAVMLSGETSIGAHPVLTVAVVRSILEDVEKYPGLYHQPQPPAETGHVRSLSDFVIHTACSLARDIEAPAIATMTHSGYSGLRTASFRPKARIFIFTSNRKLLSRFCLVWGTDSLFYDNSESTDQTIGDIRQILKEHAGLEEGDLIINITSMPIHEQGMSNTLRLSRI